MTSRTQPVRFTYEDLLHLPDDGKRHEIIDGEHYVTPSPNTRHQRVVGRLYLALARYLEQHPLGELFVAPLDVFFSNVSVVEPDLVYVSAARSSVVIDAHVRGAPDLAVEVVSPTTRKTDELTKRKLYERSGVAEYWVVDPELDAIKVYRRDEHGAYPSAIELTREHEHALSSTLFPGFSVPLEVLFR